MTTEPSSLQHLLAGTALASWAQPLESIRGRRAPERHGDYSRWTEALAGLPDLTPDRVELDQPVVAVHGQPLDAGTEAALRASLQALHPWRKGPFNLHGIQIDTEWRSDLKWDRVAPGLQDLAGRCVLDIGCGSGYHLWRMLGAGARAALGIEPTPLYVMQFRAVKRLTGRTGADVLPLALEELPSELTGFDTVFSMGVLYHRRSPLDHLQRLAALVRPGGQVVVETLVIEGDERQVLVPPGRYAAMRNVWFIPSAALLARWMQRTGLTAVHIVDESVTTTDEQRATQWMRFHSLADFLDPEDATRTIEGHPAPRRAVLTGVRPA